MTPIPVSTLRQLLRCDFETGRLFWLPRGEEWFSDGGHAKAHSCAKWNAKLAGKEAFTATSHERKEGRIFGKGYRAHRVIWALAHGEWPSDEIDHINRDPSDNRLTNLRACTHAENMRNQSSTRGSTSRFIGVSKAADRAKWSAIISPQGKAIPLGRFAREEDAARAYDRAAAKHFGAFANLNFPQEVTT